MKKAAIFALLFLYSALSFAKPTYIRGSILHFFSNPTHTKHASYQYLEDGLLVIDNGKVAALSNYSEEKLPKNATVTWYKQGLIVPGFIDTHIHYPQLDMIAANAGGHLLEWLNKYTFPFERKFREPNYAQDVAQFFLNELLRNGTTTALVFATRYENAVDALFTAAEEKHMRLITGKVLADRNLPEYLIEAPNEGVKATKMLIQKWHEKINTRLLYAITFRFAPTTSETLFLKLRQLKTDYPSVYLYTHISETKPEVSWSNKLFNSKNYLAIYDKYNLLGSKTLLAHGIYLSKAELERMHATHTSVAFCPTSNLFLGSGLFNLANAEKAHVNVGLGTDVGAGTSFSILQTMNEAYKVLQLQNQTLSSLQAFYLATLGGAKALNLEDKLGNFAAGKEADFVVLDMAGATPLLKRRLAVAHNLDDRLFVLMTLGDDRTVLATYVDGKLAYQRGA